jgi:hypothetical protein
MMGALVLGRDFLWSDLVCYTAGNAAAGIDFTAVVTTYGSTPCTRDLRGFPREVVLRFAAPGDAVVRVVGRTFRGDTVSVRRTVVVRPR